MSTHVLSMINMKGGVGKTNTSVNLAADLVKHFNKKVLLIDLDPQTNATFSLMDSSTWESWIEEHGTLWDVLNIDRDFRIAGDDFDINNCIVKNVKNKIHGLDLLPSHLECVNLDVDLVTPPNAHTILHRRISSIKDDYDFIICDCPPNVSKVTQSGIYASNSYLMPIEPDFLAAIGAGLLENRIEYLRQLMDTKIDLFGVLFTKVRINENQMQRMMAQLRAEFGTKIFDTIIYKRVDYSKSTEKSMPICIYKPKSDAARLSKKFAAEFIERSEENSFD